MEHNEQISNDLSDEGVEAMEEDDQHMDEIKPARFSLNETQVDSLLAENPAGEFLSIKFYFFVLWLWIPCIYSILTRTILIFEVIYGTFHSLKNSWK